MTIDEDLTFSVDSRFNSISLHAPEPLNFYGAEVMDSPLPFPSRHIPGYLDSTSEESDSREFKIQRLRTTNYGWTSVVVCL